MNDDDLIICKGDKYIRKSSLVQFLEPLITLHVYFSFHFETVETNVYVEFTHSTNF